MMLMSRNYLKQKLKKKIVGATFLILKPFIIPIIIVLAFIILISSITDILYIAFDNDDKIDMKKELAYYDTEYEKDKDYFPYKSILHYADMLADGGSMIGIVGNDFFDYDKNQRK